MHYHSNTRSIKMLNFNWCCSAASALAVSTFLPDLVIAGALDDGEDSVAPHAKGNSGAAPQEERTGEDDTASQHREEENIVPPQDR
jgi:hypothetical protein